MHARKTRAKYIFIHWNGSLQLETLLCPCMRGGKTLCEFMCLCARYNHAVMKHYTTSVIKTKWKKKKTEENYGNRDKNTHVSSSGMSGSRDSAECGSAVQNWVVCLVKLLCTILGSNGIPSLAYIHTCIRIGQSRIGIWSIRNALISGAAKISCLNKIGLDRLSHLLSWVARTDGVFQNDLKTWQFSLHTLRRFVDIMRERKVGWASSTTTINIIIIISVQEKLNCTLYNEEPNE